ncbi:hypothetical protein D3C75_158570 [compost metagenome]
MKEIIEVIELGETITAAKKLSTTVNWNSECKLLTVAISRYGENGNFLAYGFVYVNRPALENNPYYTEAFNNLMNNLRRIANDNNYVNALPESFLENTDRTLEYMPYDNDIIRRRASDYFCIAYDKVTAHDMANMEKILRGEDYDLL